jgi:hypothetical protein
VTYLPVALLTKRPARPQDTGYLLFPQFFVHNIEHTRIARLIEHESADCEPVGIEIVQLRPLREARRGLPFELSLRPLGLDAPLLAGQRIGHLAGLQDADWPPSRR